MRSKKGSRQIVVQNVEYRWHAKGNDGCIHVSIWTKSNVGPMITGILGYDETWMPQGAGRFSSKGDQLVVTNRLIRRIIEHALAARKYDPCSKGGELDLGNLEKFIKLDDAIRASRRDLT
jgi:hypothetical protein